MKRILIPNIETLGYELPPGPTRPRNAILNFPDQLFYGPSGFVSSIALLLKGCIELEIQRIEMGETVVDNMQFIMDYENGQCVLKRDNSLLLCQLDVDTQRITLLRKLL